MLNCISKIILDNFTEKQFFVKQTHFYKISTVKQTERPCSGGLNENFKLVRADVQVEPKTSTRRRVTQLELSEQTLRIILYLDFIDIYTKFKLCSN